MIALFHGYIFVPEYRFLFLILFHSVKKLVPVGDHFKRPLSTTELVCEVIALLTASFSLIVPYKLYAWTFYMAHSPRIGWIVAFTIGYVVYRVHQEIAFGRKLKDLPVFVDFSKTDQSGNIILSSIWTMRDLERYFIERKEGNQINVYGYTEKNEKQTKQASGRLHFDSVRKHWVVILDENNLVPVQDSLPRK